KGHVILRLLHADLPRGLERSLDATEYLGPVKVISTYRDPDGSGAVRVDVDLAQDVPNRVRVDGNRLYWDFQKQIVNMGALEKMSGTAHVRAQSLVPAARFIAARTFAGFHMGPVLLHAQAAQTLGPG